MAKLQELRDFDDDERPATERFALGQSDTTGPRLGLSEDLLADWIRESGPPEPAGSEPVTVDGRTRRAPSRRQTRRSGFRVRSRARERLVRLLRVTEAIVCVALWSLLLLWLAGTAARAPGLITPARDVTQGVSAMHARGVEAVSDWFRETLAD